MKNIFYFRKSDRRAIVALGCIAVFCIGVLLVVDRHSTQPVTAADGEAMKDTEKITPPISGISLRAFDPNTVDSLTLVGMGIEGWKVRNFLHYRAAGKVFRSADDMGRTYGWTAEDVERVTPYVRVDALPAKGKVTRREERGRRMDGGDTAAPVASDKFRSLVKVDVNEADSATLCRIPGIGVGISNAILRYRQRLGGFYAPQQLLEISIFSPELLEWFTVSDTPSLTKININQASFQTLNSHPYITYEQTKALLQYLRLYGTLQDEDALLSTGIFTPEELEKLTPYLSYE